MKKILFLLIVMVTITNAGRLATEREYQDVWCDGDKEVMLIDRTRVDCLTDEHAIEIDFANKWAECIGQALHYGIMTGKKPACALIIEKESDMRHLERLKRIADMYFIRVYIIPP